MSRIIEFYDEAYKSYQTPHGHDTARTFKSNDYENIALFVKCLHGIKGVENIEESKPNNYGITSVWYTPTTITAHMLCRALCDSLCEE